MRLELKLDLAALRAEFNQAVRANKWDLGSVRVHGENDLWKSKWIAHYIQQNEMPHCNELANGIPGQTAQLRWLVLGSGSMLPRHGDFEKPKQWRVHIPVRTDKHNTFIVWKDGVPHDFATEIGTAWILDPALDHFCANGSKNDRVHLVIDKFESPEFLEWLRQKLG